MCVDRAARQLHRQTADCTPAMCPEWASDRHGRPSGDASRQAGNKCPTTLNEKDDGGGYAGRARTVSDSHTMTSSVVPAPIRQQLKRGLEAFLSSAGNSDNKARKPLHLIWSSRAGWPYAGSSQQRPRVDIAVLDSSFNPPHLAHLSLAASQPILGRGDPQEKHYSAHLLLLSSRNADKPSNRAGDASAEQRLLMMYQLAKDLEARLAQDGIQQPNVAVGVVEEPLMADKSTLIHEWLRNHHPSTSSPPRLHWVVGYDTIVRFFDVKYYPSREAFARICEQYFDKEQTTFVCARRVLEDGSGGSGSTDATIDEKRQQMRKEEDTFLDSEFVKPYARNTAPSVAIFDLPQEAQRASSTLVRKVLMDSELSTQDKLARLQPLLSSNAMAELLVEEGIYSSGSQ